MDTFIVLTTILLTGDICYWIHKASAQKKPRASKSGWGPWSEWQCTKTCEKGAGRKTRVCVNPGQNKCSGRKSRYGWCNEQPCPVAPKPINAKGWMPWMPWDCPVTCGGGSGIRSRICEDPDICEGPEEEKGPCGEEPCPVDPDAINEDLQKQIDQQMKTVKHNIMVSEGEVSVVQCKGSLSSVLDREFPNAKVTWVRNGELVEVDTKRIKMEKGGNLKVKASIEDNGLWWCAVDLTTKVAATLSFTAFGVQNEKPDVIIAVNEPFELKCMATHLTRLVKSRLDQKWMHNSTSFKELQNVKPEEADILKIPTSNYSHNGIWNCRYTERGSNLREWVTSVTRVSVVPPKTILQKLLPLAAASILVIISIAAIASIYWKRKKKDLETEEEDDEEYEYDDEYFDEFY